MMNSLEGDSAPSSRERARVGHVCRAREQGKPGHSSSPLQTMLTSNVSPSDPVHAPGQGNSVEDELFVLTREHESPDDA